MQCCCPCPPTVLPSCCLYYSLYLQLQRLYRERADADVAAVESHLQQLLPEAGSPGRSIPTSEVKHFCKNARNIRVIRWVHLCVGREGGGDQADIGVCLVVGWN